MSSARAVKRFPISGLLNKVVLRNSFISIELRNTLGHRMNKYLSNILKIIMAYMTLTGDLLGNKK